MMSEHNLFVPLELAGAFTGLTITRASFGFMAIEKALLQAGLVRLRAVLVTVFATVCGLIPLGLQGGAQWRPLTAVHIFGLGSVKK